MSNTYIQKADAFMGSLDIAEIYRVGGSVRDEILGRRIKDADYMIRGVGLADIGRKLLAAGGKPTPLKLRDGRVVGWRANAKGFGLIEIVLPRKEVSDGPGHRDFKIVADPMIPVHEDAERRDFTFNALYKLLPEGPVADPTSRGLHDLQHRLVMTTHPDSFRDDPLRILRALRFVSVLGYDLTAEAEAQMREHAAAVTGLTADGNPSGTIFAEMSKLLMGDDVAKALRIAAATGVLGTLFPELAPMIGFEQDSRYHDMTTDEHTFQALDTAAKCEAPSRVRWALLFHDAGKPQTAWRGDDGRLHYYARAGAFDVRPNDGHLNMDHEEQSAFLWRNAATRINVDRHLREDVAVLVRNHMVACTGKVKASKVRRARVQFGDGMLRDLHMHRMCDLAGKGNKNRNMLVHVAAQEEIRHTAEQRNVPAAVKDLAVGGRDAATLGLEGKAIGDALRAVLDEVVCEPTEQRRSREWQMDALRRVAA